MMYERRWKLKISLLVLYLADLYIMENQADQKKLLHFEQVQYYFWCVIAQSLYRILFWHIWRNILLYNIYIILTLVALDYLRNFSDNHSLTMILLFDLILQHLLCFHLVNYLNNYDRVLGQLGFDALEKGIFGSLHFKVSKNITWI